MSLSLAAKRLVGIVFTLMLNSNIVMASVELFGRAREVSPGSYQDCPRSPRWIYSHQSHALNPLIEFFEYLAAFADISANFSAALNSINSGITDPNVIFAQSYEEVVAAWQSFEAKRKTMTYLPYKY